MGATGSIFEEVRDGADSVPGRGPESLLTIFCLNPLKLFLLIVLQCSDGNNNFQYFQFLLLLSSIFFVQF
jgi:hypothetical protein